MKIDPSSPKKSADPPAVSSRVGAAMGIVVIVVTVVAALWSARTITDANEAASEASSRAPIVREVTAPSTTTVHLEEPRAEEPLDEGAVALQEYLALDLTPDLVGEATREEEDEAAKIALLKKATLLAELTEALHARASQDPAAWLTLHKVHVDMGDSLMEMPRPAYLNGDQIEIYDEALQAKAGAQYDLASEALDQADDALAADDPLRVELRAAREAMAAR